MQKLLKYTAYFFAGLITLLVVTVFILKLIPDEQYKDWITSATTSATGRDFSIENLELDIGKTFLLRVDNIRLANAEWAKDTDMLQIKRLEADFGLLALLTGKADIRAVVEQADVQSEKNAGGVSNWAMGAKNQQEAEEQDDDEDESEFSGLPLDPIIREIRIDDFTLSVVKVAGEPAKITHLKQLLIETPGKDTTISLSANANGHPVEMSGNLGNMSLFMRKASEPVKLKATIGKNILNLSGNWGPIFPKQTMLVDVDLNIPAITDLAKAAGLEIGEFEDINISGKIVGDGSTLALRPFAIDLDDPATKLSIKGLIANLINMNGIDISMDSSSTSVDKLLKKLNIVLPVPLPPEININAKINGSLNELDLSELIIEAHDEGMDIKASASIVDLLHARKITGKLSGTADSLSRLSRYTKMDLPSVGALQLTGNLASNDKALQLNNLDIRLNSDNINFDVTGKVDDLFTISGIDTLAKADISSFSKQNITELIQFFKQFGIDLRAEMLPQSLSLRTAIQGSLKKLSLMNINGEVLDKGIKAGLSGAVEDVLQPSGADLKLFLDSDSIASLSKYTGSELPQTDPLKMLLTVTEDASKHSVVMLHAETGGANIDINTALETLTLPEQLELDLTLKAASMSAFNKLAQLDFRERGPLDASAKLHIQKKTYSVNDLTIQLDDQSASGNLTFSLPEKDAAPGVINGKLDIAYLDLDFLTHEEEAVPAEGEISPAAAETKPAEGEISPTAAETKPAEGEISPTTAETKPAEGEASPAVTETKPVEVKNTENINTEPEINTDRLFSTEPILSDALHDYEINFAINANKIQLGKTNMQDVQIVASLKDALFSIEPIKGAGGAGNINGFIRINGQNETPEMKMELAMLQFPMPNIGGKLDFNADLAGKGNSVADLMGSLDGQILIVGRDGRIEDSLAKKLGSGLLSFSSEKNYTTLECGILRVDIKDGIADFNKKLAAQLTEVTWRGGGTINLKTEKLDAGIVPKPRKGIPINLTGSLAGLVHIGGTLKNPKVQLDPKDVAVKYAKYSAYIYTGGLSLVAEAIKNKIDANQDICTQILDGTVFEEKGKDKEGNNAEKESSKAIIKEEEANDKIKAED